MCDTLPKNKTQNGTHKGKCEFGTRKGSQQWKKTHLGLTAGQCEFLPAREKMMMETEMMDGNGKRKNELCKLSGTETNKKMERGMD